MLHEQRICKKKTESVLVEQVVLDDILYTSPDSHPEYYILG